MTRDIKGFEGLYAITRSGRVWSYPKKWKSGRGVVRSHAGRYLRIGVDDDGYRQVGLSKGGKYFSRKIHRLIAEAFIPNPRGLPQVNHINGIKVDNRLRNLEWCTGRYNTQEAYRMGLTNNTGEHNGRSKLTVEDVRAIRRLAKSRTRIAIANRYKVSDAVVCDIVNRKSWKHVA